MMKNSFKELGIKRGSQVTILKGAYIFSGTRIVYSIKKKKKEKSF